LFDTWCDITFLFFQKNHCSAKICKNKKPMMFVFHFFALSWKKKGWAFQKNVHRLWMKIFTLQGLLPNLLETFAMALYKALEKLS
jgi:hypothetical protein